MKKALWIALCLAVALLLLGAVSGGMSRPQEGVVSIRTHSIAVLASGALAILPSVRAASGEITIPRGTAIDVLVEDALSSRTAKVGDEVHAVLARAVWIDGQLALRKGTVVEG